MNATQPLPEDIEARIQAEVQQRLAVIMAGQQEQFAAMMQSAMQNALGGVDHAGRALEEEREALLREKDAVRELFNKAEREGEAMASEAYERHSRQYEEAARLGLLRTLVRRQVEAGRETSEIARLFMVEPEFVTEIRAVVDRVHRFRQECGGYVPPGARILISSEGRGGTITYQGGVTEFDLWWEFGTNALALVEVPTPEAWSGRTGLPAGARQDILAFIGQEILTRQAPDGSFTIGENVLTVYAGGQ